MAARSIDLGDHLPCYQLLCEMCKHVSQAKRGLHDREKFRAACAQHLKLFCKCYGANATVPKHHFHMHSAYDPEDKLFDCFAGERKNRFIKQCAQPVRLQKRYEFSVLIKAIALQLDALDASDNFEDRLVRPKAAHESGWTTSREAVVGGNSLRLGDVIVACNRAIVVEAFRRGPNSSSSTSPIVLSADLYALDAQVTRSSKAFAITARDVQLRVDQFHMVTVWYFQGDARLVLL